MDEKKSNIKKTSILHVQIRHFKHWCSQTAFELKLWIFVVIVRIQEPRGDWPLGPWTHAPLKTCPETFRWELENLTTLVLNKLGCVLNFPITDVPEIMKYEDCNVACVYFHINITFSTHLPQLLHTIPCQFLLGPSMPVGATLEPLDLDSVSLLCVFCLLCLFNLLYGSYAVVVPVWNVSDGVKCSQ